MFKDMFLRTSHMIRRCRWVAAAVYRSHDTATPLKKQIGLLRNDAARQCQAQSMFSAIRRLEDRRGPRGINGFCRLLVRIARIQLALLY